MDMYDIRLLKDVGERSRKGDVVKAFINKSEYAFLFTDNHAQLKPHEYEVVIDDDLLAQKLVEWA